MPKKSVGKTNRRKGHNAERYYANFFKDLGYTFCKTARQASRLHDDCGIDLMYLPFLVQIKAGKQRGLKRADTLQYIEDRVKEYQNKGIGTQMLQLLEVEAKKLKIDKIRGSVREDNISSKQLFEKNNYILKSYLFEKSLK